MFEPWKQERQITVAQRYGISNPAIPKGRWAVAFRPPKKGERFLGTCLGSEVIASADYSNDSPVIILAPVLTEIEEKYGEGETVESVWAKHCPRPEKYGKPRADGVPSGNTKPFAWVVPPNSGYSRELFEPPDGWNRPGYVYAYLLNNWQQLYGEEITDAAALEAKLRAEGKLKDSQFIEPELREVAKGETLVTRDRIAIVKCGYSFHSPRAIVGTRKRGYIRIPYESFAKCLTSPMCGQVPVLLPGSEVVFYGVKGTYVEE